VLYNFDGDSCLSTKAGSKGPVPVNIDDVKRLIEEVAYDGIAAPKSGLFRDPEYTFERVSHCASVSHGDSGRGDELYLALLNKDARQPVEVQITVEDWPLKTSVEIHEVRANSYLAENTIKSPNTVTLAGPKVDRVEDFGKMTYQLKPNTLAVLRFQNNERRGD
jgi:alpha-L-arabinofuranosidase